MKSGSRWVKFRDRLKNSGLKDTLRTAMLELRPGRFFGDYLDVLGVLDGLHAYKGPEFAQIDLTNDCNNNCIGCWCNSPLLGDKRIRSGDKRRTLSLKSVLKLLDELSAMATRHIYYAGGGEPFMHPDIMEILRYTKRKGFVCYVNTNFTLLDEEKIRKIVDLKVDHLTVSVWAATPEAYCFTHPNKEGADFLRIKEMLSLLNRIKRGYPVVKLYNVIFNMNYHELSAMVDFAADTNSEAVEFTVIDTIPGRTDKLLLNPQERSALLEECRKIEQRSANARLRPRPQIMNLRQFARRIENAASSSAEYDSDVIGSMPCYAGWAFTRILADGSVNSCLKSHRFPVGNIRQESFKKIWNDRRQRYFRRKAYHLDRSDPFFKIIGNDPDSAMGCYKSCDNLGHNMEMHGKMSALSARQRRWLERAAGIMKSGRRYYYGMAGGK